MAKSDKSKSEEDQESLVEYEVHKPIIGPGGIEMPPGTTDRSDPKHPMHPDHEKYYPSINPDDLPGGKNHPTKPDPSVYEKPDLNAERAADPDARVDPGMDHVDPKIDPNSPGMDPNFGEKAKTKRQGDVPEGTQGN